MGDLLTLVFLLFLLSERLGLDQAQENYGPLAKSSPLPVLVNEVSLECNMLFHFCIAHGRCHTTMDGKVEYQNRDRMACNT